MSRSTRLFILAFACYTVLACVLTYPLVRHLSAVVPHDLGDPLMSTTLLWWNAHVVPLTERWWNGFAFYPAPGMLAFSDHRLGESLIAAPLMWLGASPIAAYNVTLLAMFPLSAIAAHWAAFAIAKRHDAAAISGLAFGFCPYRFAHIPHLELLAAFGMPLALGSLHKYKDTRQQRWLVLFALALVLQGLCTSYYLLFFSVLLGLWILWFARRDDLGMIGAVLVAAAGALIALLPIVIGFWRIHNYYGLSRPYDEIVSLSADATSYLTAHSTSTLWGWTSRWAKSEGELFPGATISILALVGVLLARRRTVVAADQIDRRSRWLLPIVLAAGVTAFCGWAFAPWHLSIIGIRLSSDAPFKACSVALLALVAWGAASSTIRAGYRKRSTLLFYVIATVALAVCSFGPKPAFAGHQFLYEAPYGWLMEIPVFESVRVPARFGLVVVLTLSLAAALAFNRLTLAATRRRFLAVIVLAGVIADGWIVPLMLPTMPDVWPAARAQGFDAVLELPLGEVFDDTAAMYRAMDHGRPLVNGASGFGPTHYFTLLTALAEHDPSIFEGFPPGQRLLVVVDDQKDGDRRWREYVRSVPGATLVADDGRWAFFALDTPPAASVCAGRALPIVAIATNDTPADLRLLTDRNPKTWWATSHAQRAGDALTLDLGSTTRPCAVALSVGEFRISYPRRLAVETSVDGQQWTTVARHRMAGLTMQGALRDPKAVTMMIPLAGSRGRFVRLRADEPHPTIAWLVTDVAIRIADGEE
jgi:hypothetical protein